MIPTMDLRAVPLTREEREAAERRAMRRENEQMRMRLDEEYRQLYAKCKRRWEDVKVECFLRGEPEKAPPFEPPVHFPYYL